MAVPMLETTLTLHMTVKAKWLNGPQRDGVASLGVEAIVTERPRLAATLALVCGMNCLGSGSSRQFANQQITRPRSLGQYSPLGLGQRTRKFLWTYSEPAQFLEEPG
jgi:hypothetical protein